MLSTGPSRLLLLLSLLLSACTKSHAPQQVLSRIQLSYSETGGNCINCPAFKATMGNDGWVDYECTSGCPVPGKQTYQVPPQRFAPLVQAFYDADFFSIPRTDPSRVVYDAPVFRLTYRDDIRIHEVVNDDRKIPELDALIVRFRTAIDADRFGKPSLAMYQKLVKAGWNANTVGVDQQNALTSAVVYGDFPSAQYLVEDGVTVTDSAISWAARSQNANLLRLVLPVSAIHADKRRAALAVLAAAWSPIADSMRYLLDAGAPVDGDPSDGSPLIHAVATGNLESTELLLRHGADPNLADKDGARPLWQAAALSEPLTKLLLEHGASVDAATPYGETALMRAAQSCSVEIIQTLLKAGANPNLKNKKGQTAGETNFSSDPRCQTARKLLGRP